MQIRLLGNTLLLCLVVVSVLAVPVKIVGAAPDDRHTLLVQTSPGGKGQESGLPLFQFGLNAIIFSNFEKRASMFS